MLLLLLTLRLLEFQMDSHRSHCVSHSAMDGNVTWRRGALPTNLADEVAVDSFTVGIAPFHPDCEYLGHF